MTKPWILAALAFCMAAACIAVGYRWGSARFDREPGEVSAELDRERGEVSAEPDRERGDCDGRALSLLLSDEEPDWMAVARCVRASKGQVSAAHRTRIIEELLHGRRNPALFVFDDLADDETATVLLGHLRDTESSHVRRYILSALERMPVELSGAQLEEIAYALNGDLRGDAYIVTFLLRVNPQMGQRVLADYAAGR